MPLGKNSKEVFEHIAENNRVAAARRNASLKAAKKIEEHLKLRGALFDQLAKRRREIKE